MKHLITAICVLLTGCQICPKDPTSFTPGPETKKVEIDKRLLEECEALKDMPLDTVDPAVILTYKKMDADVMGRCARRHKELADLVRTKIMEEKK